MAEAHPDRKRPTAQWYEEEVAIRGCRFSLRDMQAVCREFVQLTRNEGRKVVSSFTKPDDMSDEDFLAEKERVFERAFRVTISIIGFDGQSVYDDDPGIFSSEEIPNDIRTIYFTSENSFKGFFNESSPRNHFSIWIHFDKPPIFDPNPLLSSPTPNASQAHIKAEDTEYYRACRSIIYDKLMSKKNLYRIIHEKFMYDIGVWFVVLPIVFYIAHMVSQIAFEGNNSTTLQVAILFYVVGISLILYRSFVGYIKWVFPVNFLEENIDAAKGHRYFMYAVATSLVASAIYGLTQLW